MADTPTAPQSSPAGSGGSAVPASLKDLPRVIIRSYPKIIFFWLTWIASLVMGIIHGGEGPEIHPHLGTIWMCIFAFNVLVISFDFTEVVSVMVLAVGVALVLGLIMLGWLGPLGDFFGSLKIYMNRAFYFTIFGLFSIVYLIVFIRTRFDYWEFRYNEVIHRRGIFADIKRYSTEDLRWFKEIPDVLERILAGSGRMILTTPREAHPIVIDHVLRIGSIDEEVADILGTKRVVITQ